jgi:hypothetical protein
VIPTLVVQLAHGLEGGGEFGPNGFRDGQTMKHRRKRGNARPRLLGGGPVRHFLDEPVEARRIREKGVGEP